MRVDFIPNRLDFIPNEVGFTREMNLFIPKLNKSYHASWADTARRAGAVEGVATDARGMKRTGDTSSSSEESESRVFPECVVPHQGRPVRGAYRPSRSPDERGRAPSATATAAAAASPNRLMK